MAMGEMFGDTDYRVTEVVQYASPVSPPLCPIILLSLHPKLALFT